MSAPLRLVIFDVDGTLVDSQNDILGAVQRAFDANGLAAPARADVLGIVGLSLPVAMEQLAPQVAPDLRIKLVEGYKSAYVEMRATVGAAKSSPLYPGARTVLDALQSMPDILLGVATGKSKRGLDKLIEAHGLEGYFVTQQVADFHPSKPNPSMIHQAMSEVGVDAAHSVMVGDTCFDMEMATSAGVQGIGVSWGYHPISSLTDATHIIDDFQELPKTLSAIWEKT
ncbi:MAG: HAD-IA family hydrolase [Roseobacter sp.]